MENVFKAAYNALLVTKTEDGGHRTWNADGSDDIKVYDEVQDYLASRRYPNSDEDWERRDSETSKKKLSVDGVLHYKQSSSV